jgi:hypothetical protein
MSRKSMFEAESPHQFRTATLTRLFDLLLVAGYLACGILTYVLFTGDSAPPNPPPTAAPTPVVVAAASPTPEAVVVAGSLPTPAPFDPVAPPPEATPATAKPASEDLLAAMSDYVNFINQGDVSAARAMRADPNAPPTDKLKQVKSMTLKSIVAYPRISRTKGSVYVEISSDKGGPPQTWKGRVDWEKKGNQWVTVNWDSAAAKPKEE